MDAVTVPANSATAVRQLNKVRDELAVAVVDADEKMQSFRTLLIDARTKGLLRVTEMAAAIGRDRNYVDGIWSAYGRTVKGGQTRILVDATEDASRAVAARELYEALKTSASEQRKAERRRDTLRTKRNQLIASIYAARMPGLGPSPIGKEVGVDRNHVLRIARDAGVKPVHRTDSRNQYTAK